MPGKKAVVFRCILAAALWMGGLSSPAQPGGFGPQVPADGGPMPRYFSGTNCRASGYAQLGNEPILFAYLHLNNELVASYAYDPNDPEPLHAITLEVMFDSSHWMDGTEVEVKFGVYGASTGWHVATGRSVVQNKAMLWEHSDPRIDAVWLAESLLQGKNYTLDVRNGGRWSREEYIAAMDGSNVIFYDGHGTPDVHRAGDDNGIHWYDHYELPRIQQIGGGIPPFNTGAPPVNFIYLLCCRCGVTNNFVRACYPYYMAWGGPWMENQALMAWRPEVLLKDYETLTAEILGPMSEGQTAAFAHAEFNKRLSSGVLEFDVIDNGVIRPMVPGDLALYAGPEEYGCVRIKSVYTGTNAPPVGWYRVTVPF
ncbi:MAG: hypothetical protein KatS3mg015_1766 [Fimbriimonadales bacterium]|nr:MAG: hypothetical protein KatS3mg015_1766 [Fimbriimonadales bacterium]